LSTPDALSVRQALAQSGLAPLDARVLLAHVAGKDRAWLIAHAGDALPQQMIHDFFAAARRRRDGEPVAYLTGSREFRSLVLNVSPDVLIPRPETETLVDAALEQWRADEPRRVLDLGTGSGAVALALAHERGAADVLAVDASEAALAVARANARRLAIANVRFVQSDWYGAVGDARFDLIVSNPPYVAAGDPHLGEGDLCHEPRAALTPGADGLAALRVIIEAAPRHLVPGGRLWVEHGHDQGAEVRELFAAQGFEDIVARRDLAGHLRVAGGRRR